MNTAEPKGPIHILELIARPLLTRYWSISRANSKIVDTSSVQLIQNECVSLLNPQSYIPQHTAPITFSTEHGWTVYLLPQIVCSPSCIRWSLSSPEAEAGNSDRGKTLCLAVRATAIFVLADLQLDVVWTLSTSLIFTTVFVHLV